MIIEKMYPASRPASDSHALPAALTIKQAKTDLASHMSPISERATDRQVFSNSLDCSLEQLNTMQPGQQKKYRSNSRFNMFSDKMGSINNSFKENRKSDKSDSKE